MEGPSLFLAKEQLKPFKKKVVISATGNTKLDKAQFVGKQVRDIYSWGKHLIFQFDTFAIRVHFLLWGTFSAEVQGKSVTGDYEIKSRVPRLALTFSNGKVEMYNCSIKILEDKNSKKSYDFSADIMSKKWDPEKALRKIKKDKEEEIGDVLLDQDIFAGVGNIIKNEVLFIVKIHPQQKIEDISLKKLKEIIMVAQSFSIQFYKWRKVFRLRANLKIYRKGSCPLCGTKIIREKTGKRQRWSFYCPFHQPLW